MGSSNLAIVRVLSDKYKVPTDGKITPISEVPYLCYENKTPFYFEMRNILRRKGLLGSFDNPMSEKEIEETMLQYMPYSSSYNSMTLWTINGIVPDDNYAQFSKKTCAVIDDLQGQLEQSKIVSMVPTDLAIHGSTQVTDSATIVIKKDRYDELSVEDKQLLTESFSKIKIFEGDISEAVNEELVNSSRYTAETLSLDREDRGYKKSPTSDEVIENIAKIAKERNIPQVLHLKVITGEHDEVGKLDEFKEDMSKMYMVKTYYKQAFFEYMFSKMDIDDNVKAMSMFVPDSDTYMEQLCEEIGRIGINQYKEVLNRYNKSLEILRRDGILPTPQQIVDSISQDKKIKLVQLVEGVDKQIEEDIMPENVLPNAIEATEEVVTTSSIKDQVKTIEQIRNEKIQGMEIE